MILLHNVCIKYRNKIEKIDIWKDFILRIKDGIVESYICSI
jgi:hypothetical protein